MYWLSFWGPGRTGNCSGRVQSYWCAKAEIPVNHFSDHTIQNRGFKKFLIHQHFSYPAPGLRPQTSPDAPPLAGKPVVLEVVKLLCNPILFIACHRTYSPSVYPKPLSVLCLRCEIRKCVYSFRARHSKGFCCKHLRRNRWKSCWLTPFDNKKVPISKIYWEYLKTVEILGTRFGLNENDVVLAFDYADEDLYGDP